MADLKNTLKELEDRMNKTISFMQGEFSAIRAGRASPHILGRITANYYGTQTPLQQVGNVSMLEARVALIQPWDKSLLKEIEKAILTSDLGINLTNDGSVVRLLFPELAEERRKTLTKDIRKKGETARIAVRNIRHSGADVFKKMEKANEITEDDLSDANEKLQKLTDKAVERIDKAVEVKDEKLMTVRHTVEV